MDLGIEGRVAVITGAASGMGLETAKLLAAEGAKLILSDLESDALEKALGEIGGDHATQVADLEKKRGRVVFITSENAVQPYPDEAVYNAAKAALLNFTKCLSLGYAERGVLVNAVSPAFIESPMTDGMMEKRAEEKGVSKEEAIESFLAEERPYLKLGRRGRIEEVAPVIAMLCSERASFVTGAAWRVDGGAVGAMNL